ncbi:MAG: AEC family transporter [Pseudomonadota bacterium]|nr:MAG: AEC family transporter [Pseudomonadota bacterium]
MSSVILLMVCFVVGMLLRRSGRMPPNAHTVLNSFIIHVSLPALTLISIHRLTFDKTLLAPAAMAWVMFGLGCAFFWWVGRVMRWRRATTGALMLTGSLANTSFIGVPMIEAYFGHRGIGLGILIDQAGTYLVLSTMGMLIATIYSQGGKPTVRAAAKRVFTFVPFLAFLLALVLMPVHYPPWAVGLLDRLGGTLVPLALVSVGYQIQFGEMQGRVTELSIGLGFKLLLAPLVIGVIYAGLFGGRGEITQITIFEAAMPPQIGAAIVAMEHDLDPQLVTLMVGVGIPLSFLTLPLWYQALSLMA